MVIGAGAVPSRGDRQLEILPQTPAGSNRSLNRSRQGWRKQSRSSLGFGDWQAWAIFLSGFPRVFLRGEVRRCVTVAWKFLRPFENRFYFRGFLFLARQQCFGDGGNLNGIFFRFLGVHSFLFFLLIFPFVFYFLLF